MIKYSLDFSRAGGTIGQDNTALWSWRYRTTALESTIGIAARYYR
jgi:hypothetical protein